MTRSRLFSLALTTMVTLAGLGVGALPPPRLAARRGPSWCAATRRSAAELRSRAGRPDRIPRWRPGRPPESLWALPPLVKPAIIYLTMVVTHPPTATDVRALLTTGTVLTRAAANRGTCGWPRSRATRRSPGSTTHRHRRTSGSPSRTPQASASWRRWPCGPHSPAAPSCRTASFSRLVTSGPAGVRAAAGGVRRRRTAERRGRRAHRARRPRRTRAAAPSPARSAGARRADRSGRHGDRLLGAARARDSAADARGEARPVLHRPL